VHFTQYDMHTLLVMCIILVNEQSTNMLYSLVV
jgi:hypothetical protein